MTGIDEPSAWHRFHFSDRHRAQILGIDPRFSTVLEFIEDRIDDHKFRTRTQKMVRDGSPNMINWRVLPVSALGSRAEFLTVADLAEKLMKALASLSTFRKEVLGDSLSEYKGHNAVCHAVGEPKAGLSWWPEDCPSNLTPYVVMLRRLLDEARDASPSPQRRRRPQLYDDLVQFIAGACDFLKRHDDDWTAFTAPKGKFCRLLGVCFEAGGLPSQTNISQLVRRALGRWGNEEDEAEADYARWKKHCAGDCGAECNFCEP